MRPPYRLSTALEAPRFVRSLGARRGLRTLREFIAAAPGEVLEAPVPGSKHTVRVRAGSGDRRAYERVFVGQRYALDYGVRDPKLIVDAGAHAGYAAVYFAERFPGATVLAIEPEASNLALLRDNVAPYPNIRVIEGSLWYRRERLHLRAAEADGESVEVEATRDSAPPPAIGVQAHTVDDLLELTGEQRVDILHADVDGGEFQLLRHADDWITSVRALVIELHPQKSPGVQEVYDAAVAARAVRTDRQGDTHYALLR